MQFVAIGMYFDSCECPRDLDEIRTALEKARASAFAEYASIVKARENDKLIDQMLTSLEKSGDFHNSLGYMILRNVHAVCDKLHIEYIGDADDFQTF